MTRDYILTMIETYIARQQIVCEAMAELRPDKIVIAGMLSEDDDNLDELLSVAEWHKDAPYSGFWNKHGRWRYSIHGNGCRLTNLETGELLDWDAPDKEVFDLYFFVNWFVWATKQELHARDITDAVLKPTIVELESDGSLIRVGSSNSDKFRLNKLNENDQPNEYLL